MIKLSSVASILFGIAWLVPSRADELADQPIAGADRSRELASAQPSTTKARPSRPQRAFVPMDFKRMFTAGPLSDPQPPSTLLPAGAVTVDLTLRAATPTLCRYSVGKDLPYDQMTPFDTEAPSSSPRTIVRGLDADPGRVNDVYIRSAAAPSAALHLQYRSLPASKPGFPRTANLWGSWRFLSGGMEHGSTMTCYSLLPCKAAGLALIAAGLLAASPPAIKGWGQADDPDGDCRFEARDSKLTIRVPGTLHNLVADRGRLNAPTVLSPVRGEFIAMVKAAGDVRPGPEPNVPDGLPYNGTGLLLWVDRDNYIRLERAGLIQAGAFISYANFEHFSGGRRTFSQGLEIQNLPTTLRLERRGGTVYASVSQDGVNWTSFRTLEVPLPAEMKLGVAAVNTSTKPFAGELEGLTLFTRRDVDAP